MRIAHFRVMTLLALAISGAPSASWATTVTVNAPTNPVVSWNAPFYGSLNLYPNYSASTGQTAGGAGTVVASTAAAFTGTTGCTASPAQSSNVIDFSNVYVPVSGKTTACDYKNALSIGVISNDTAGYKVTEQLQLAPGSGFTLCGIENNTSFATLPTASPVTGSSTSIAETSCATGQFTLGTGTSTPASFAVGSTTVSTGSTEYYIGQDVLLLIAYATYTPGSYTSTLTVTFAPN